MTPRLPNDASGVSEGTLDANVVADPSKGHQSCDDFERALKEAKQSEARLRKIIDTIPTLAWCALPDGSHEFLNQRWHDYTGLSTEEALGWIWKVAIHPEGALPIPDRAPETS